MNTLTAVTETASNQITKISSDTSELVSQSVSPNTLTAYRTALKAFDQWLTANKRELSDSAIADYLTHLHSLDKSVSRINLVIASVNWSHKITNRPSPVGTLTSATMKGIRRAQANKPVKQAEAITWADTRTLYHRATESNSLQDLRASAIISLASNCLLRRSEIANIQVSDLTRESDSSGRLTIRKSKTDQFGEGTTLYIVKSAKIAPTMQILETWINRAGITEGALFRSITKSGKVSDKPLSARSIGAIIKSSGQSLGIKGASGHSLRVGSAQEIVERGGSLGELMQVGRWTSERMPAHYAKAQLAGRNVIARLQDGA